MRHFSDEPRCTNCFLKQRLCMCALLPRIETKSRVVVVMHSLEHHRSSNTGRLATRCLPNSDLVIYGKEGTPFDAQPWPKDHTPVVLFPIANAPPVADFRGQENLALIFLDANWRQAAKLRRRFAVQNIPFAKAPAGPSAYRLRAGPHDESMSTLEAVARSIAVVDDIDMSPLLRALEVFQDRILWLRGSKQREDVAGGIPAGVERHMTP